MTQPAPQWVYVQRPPKRRGRLALVIILCVLAVLIAVGAGYALWALQHSTARPDATNSASPSATASASPSASPAPSPSASPSAAASPTATATPTPHPTATSTPPPAADADLPAFRERVTPRLHDQFTGLDIIDEAPSDAVQIADDLITDAQRLADETAPSSLQGTWRPAVDAYLASLTTLRSALEAGTGDTADARAKADALLTLVS